MSERRPVHPAPAVDPGRQRVLAAVFALLVVALDRISKLAIQHSVTIYDGISVIPNWLRIVHTENPGAAFGFLAEGNPFLRAAVLIGISSAVLIFVAVTLWNQKGSLLSRIGLSLILGGAFGNLYDRVLHQTVTDFIEVYHGSWSFPAFNVADSAITLGAALLILDLLKPRRPVLAPAAAQTSPHASQTH